MSRALSILLIVFAAVALVEWQWREDPVDLDRGTSEAPAAQPAARVVGYPAFLPAEAIETLRAIQNDGGMEASGSSGMKVVPNGGLNLSILDGWWVEGYLPEAGWAIGKGEEYEDHTYQDAVESSALHDLLESDVVPLFYGRAADGLPRAWIARMKRSMRLLTPVFSTNRMLWEYAERYYVPAARCYERLSADGLAGARQMAAWKAAIRRGWGGVRVESVEDAGPGSRRVGEGFELAVVVRPG